MNTENKILYEEFGLILNQLNMHLRDCPHCGQPVRYKLVHNRFAQVHCPMGCGCVTVVVAEEDEPHNDCRLVQFAVHRWNSGKWDE